MTCSIRLGDEGTSLEVTIEDCDNNIVPLSGATTMNIRLKAPDDTVVTKDAALVTDGSDGKMHYIVATNDLNQEGRWGIQGYVELPAGNWSTEIGSFLVLENLA